MRGRLVVAVLALAAVAVPAEAQVRGGPRLAAAVFALSFGARGVDPTENKPPRAKAGVCTMQAAAAQQAGDLTSRTEAELRAPGFGIKWYIALDAACRMYGVPTLAERDGSRPHTALFDAEMAGRLYFAMRGIRYREPVKRVLRRLH